MPKTKKKKYVTMYMHLIDGKPAKFSAKEQEIFRTDNVELVNDLRTIRGQQKIDKEKFMRKYDRPLLSLPYYQGYCRVRVPVGLK